MKSAVLAFILLGYACILVIETKHHQHRHHHSKGKNDLIHPEKELRRSKRYLGDGERKQSKALVSPIVHTIRNRRASRPFVAGQVQDVQIQIKLKYPWDESMWNIYTPQYRLLAGNIIDEVSNELSDNRNYLEARVLKMRPSSWNVLVDLSIKFFKTVIDPVQYLEGIVTSGWISGQEVFNDYFKVLKIVNGNEPFPVWNYPKGVKLRLHPAVLTKVNAVKKVKEKITLPANYKELRISFKLYQKWNPFFQARLSSPYRLLSGNVEEALSRSFKGSSKYLDSEVLGFRESPQGQVIVDMMVRFTGEEVYPAQKLKLLISTGSISGTPVLSDSLSIYEINNIHSDKPMEEQASIEDYSKPKSEANVSQGLNETEIPKGKPVSKIKETNEPIYPLAQQNQTKLPEEQAVKSKQDVVNTNGGAILSFRLERLRMVQQSLIQQQKQNQTMTEINDNSKNNVLKETTEPIFPVQKPILSQDQPQKPIYQESVTYQKNQNKILEQQRTPTYQQPQQPMQKVDQQQQWQQQESYSPSMQTGQTASQQNNNKQAFSSSPEALTQFVAGKLVYNSQQIQNATTEQPDEEIPKGKEKQLAQNPLYQTANNQSTNEELNHLYQDIKSQNKGKNANKTQVYIAAQTENLPDSSDTPTLTKTLYPQLTQSRNGSANTEGQLIKPATFNSNSSNDAKNVSYTEQASQVNILSAAENFLTDNSEKGEQMATPDSNGAEQEADQKKEDLKTVGKILAGVISEQRHNYKAIQVQLFNSSNVSNASLINPAAPSSTGGKNNISQFKTEPIVSSSQATNYTQPYSPLYNVSITNIKPPSLYPIAIQNSSTNNAAVHINNRANSTQTMPEANQNAPFPDSNKTPGSLPTYSVWPSELKPVNVASDNSSQMTYNSNEAASLPQTTQSNEWKDKNPPLRRPHIYTPSVEVYQWPPSVAPVKTVPPIVPIVQTTLPQIGSTSSTSQTVLSTVDTKHLVHGKFILQQSWHSLLGINNSVPYKVLTGIVTHSIEQTYSLHNIQVNCKVVGLSKAAHNMSSSSSGMDKVGVQFDLNYFSNEASVKATMKEVMASGEIGGLLVYPDSLVVEEEPTLAANPPNNQTTSSSAVVATSPMPVENTVEFKAENKTMPTTNRIITTSTTITPTQTVAAEPTFEFVTAPNDLPKSCEEIRDLGIGHIDGQYVLEARKGCHLSVICQNMENKHPKEFLGGPKKGEWSAYPFAALIKISTQDKQNVAQQACLESSDEGKKLLEQIFKAKGKQEDPSVPWRTNIKQILNGKARRELKRAITTVILRSSQNEKDEERQPRSLNKDEGDWGVL